MPFCPSCRSEFREGFSWCKTCDQALVDELLPLELEGVDAVEAAVRAGEAVVVARGPLPDARGMQAVLADFRVPSVVTGDPASCGSGSCQAVYDVAVLPDHLEAAQNALAVNYHAMLRTEGVDPEQVEGVVELCAGESTTCPACQTTFVPEDIRDATCPECELYLGVPDP